ncbi:MAG: YafY family transcriptional regulator [Pseudomonadales bacterium]|nr:YafY family transcriptional regulator [Pseudomonadales bacterium]
MADINRFDRVISILTMLHTKRLITAKEIAERFGVSERTVYRDIRTLETAGVPIGSEAGLGYFLDKSYRLPPVMFDRDEAVALLLAEKFIQGIRDQKTGQSYRSALDKVKAVLGHDDKDYLEALSQRVDVHLGVNQSDTAGDRWLEEIQKAIVFSHTLQIEYYAHYRQQSGQRTIEPIGLYYYSRHWHLIAWCQTRDDYRDFRLDRIQTLAVTSDHFNRRSRASLTEYIEGLTEPQDLHAITLHVDRQIAQFMQNQKFYYGYVSEEIINDDWIEMSFLVPELEYFARWLLSYTDAIKIIEPSALNDEMARLIKELALHYGH